ncbi:protein MAINTENANCE OF MERISTEMS-like [Beta vulgaris subsp. vulgaris]|uniref:protein MAINTENANCE OF MERISTEMS-like n=1 Tax=Beta vulgaris subsp. vulgaris TaxID=3555 RepID=UPI0025475264|nr:protein MAINTENANCE OF MERISTEMS-like [Beta vulgaris subsp. vulgaris]
MVNRISYKLNEIAVTIPRILNKIIGTVSCNWDEVLPPVSYKLNEIAVTIPRILNKINGTVSCNWDEVVPPVSYKLDEMVVTDMTYKIEKKTRLDGRTVTVSARATRAARRSSRIGFNEEHVTTSNPRKTMANIERGCLVIQSRTHAIDLFRFEPRDAWYLLVKSTGLGHLRECMFPHHNAPLISAFVERWHPETNSFHLPFGEMTITLHDVSLILGLPINGVAINHPMQQKESRNSLFSFVGKLLNIDTKEIEFEHAHGGIKLSKIRETLMDPKNKYDVDDIARGFLVTLLGSTIFIDKTVDRTSTLLFPLVRDLVSVKSYSWASAALAYLYRELGKATRAETKQLAGSSTLLEVWIYEHFPMFRPMTNSNYLPGEHPRAMKWDAQTPTPILLSTLQQHRWRLDDMTAQEVIWVPYGINVVHNLPLSLYHGCIRYASIIEPYMPDRVLRQFGYVQTRPMSPITPNKENKPTHFYAIEYPESMMCFWDDPSSHCLSMHRLGEDASNPWDCSSDYMQWFLQCSHPKLQNPEHAPNGYMPRQHQLTAEARLHLIAHYLRPVYPEVRSKLSLEDQFHHIDQAIDVLLEFEKLHSSQR